MGGGGGEGVGMRGTRGGHYPHLFPLLSAGAGIFLIPRNTPYWRRVSLASSWTPLGSIWGGGKGGWMPSLDGGNITRTSSGRGGKSWRLLGKGGK